MQNAFSARCGKWCGVSRILQGIFKANNDNNSYERGTYKSWLAGRAVRLSGRPAVRSVRSVRRYSLQRVALAKYLLDLLFDFYVRINAAIRLQTMPTAVESSRVRFRVLSVPGRVFELRADRSSALHFHVN